MILKWKYVHCLATELCPAIQRPRNAEVIPHSCYTKGSSRWQLCVFVCRSGYTLVGNLTTRCGLNQLWDAPPPTCVQHSTGSAKILTYITIFMWEAWCFFPIFFFIFTLLPEKKIIQTYQNFQFVAKKHLLCLVVSRALLKWTHLPAVFHG